MEIADVSASVELSSGDRSVLSATIRIGYSWRR